MQRENGIERAVLTGLVATLSLLLVIKFLTGIAFGPLLLLGMLIFGFAFGFSLRADRARR